MNFQQAVVDKDDKAAFAEVFRSPPVSTQQILHPDKYFAGAKPASPDLPKPPSSRGYKGLIGGSFGELDHQVLLQQYAGKRRPHEIAPHWRGGQYEIIENQEETVSILLYASQWEDAGIGTQVLRGLSEDACRQVEEDGGAVGDGGYRERPRRRWRFHPAPGGQHRHQRGRDRAREMRRVSFAVITDAHYTGSAQQLSRAVEAINAERPDFTIQLGDLVDLDASTCRTSCL